MKSWFEQFLYLQKKYSFHNAPKKEVTPHKSLQKGSIINNSSSVMKSIADDRLYLNKI
jgi:hypothetical protein